MKLKKVLGVITSALSVIMLSTTVYAGTNELTGLEISDELVAQRPVAIMVDNEKKALAHYGTAEADIVCTRTGQISSRQEVFVVHVLQT